MKFFLDTADLNEIEEAASWGAIAGVTTNPTLYSRIGGKLDDFHNHIKRICDIVDGPVSAESVAMTRDDIVRDGLELASIADNVVVKVPTMVEGLAATHELAKHGVPVNMTCASACRRPFWPHAPVPATSAPSSAASTIFPKMVWRRWKTSSPPSTTMTSAMTSK